MIFALRGMDPRRLESPARPPSRRGARRRCGAALRPRRAGAADPAGDDGRGRHPGVQLPGPAAAARPLHLRGRRQRLHGAGGRDGDRLGRRRADHRRARPGLRAAAGRLGGGASGPARWSPRPPRRCPLALVALRAARRGQRHLRRRRQLDPAARREPGDARAGDGAVLGRLPRLDADRRADRRLARRDRRTTRPASCSAGVAALAAAAGGLVAFARRRGEPATLASFAEPALDRLAAARRAAVGAA